MAKYKHLFLRSEYQIALHNYRRARRRGDVAEAQRWIRLADMHLRVADRFEDSVDANKARDSKVAGPHIPEAPGDDKKDIFATRRLLDDLDRRATAYAMAQCTARRTGSP